jgi:tetratricopeptide (TPR) repeat protein
MRDLHRRRSSGLALLFAIPMVVCCHTSFAATPNSSPSSSEAATTSSTTLPTAAPLPPQLEGDLLMVHRSYAAALEAYQRDPDKSAVLWNKTGVAYHHLFAFEQARKYYLMALAINPKYPDALNNLAAVYHAEHDFKQAERTYKLALKYSPSSAITYCNLGTAYFAQEKYKPGMQAYHKALELNPHIFDAGQTQIVEETSTRRQLVAVNYYLAKTYATEGKMEEALGYLRKALEAGFRDRKQLMKDKEFASLRATPEFHQLMIEQTGGE